MHVQYSSSCGTRNKIRIMNMQARNACHVGENFGTVISNTFNPSFSGSASALAAVTRADILAADDQPRTPKEPCIPSGRSALSDVSSNALVSPSNSSLWNIIQVQQQQLTRIQDQIDRLIIAVGGLPPKRAEPFHFPDVDVSRYRQRAISSAPASLAITSGSEYVSRVPAVVREEPDDEDFVMSEEVAKLVRKYSTKLRE